MATARQIAELWEAKFNRFAGDLYPGKYDYATCLDLAEKGFEIARLRKEKKSRILVHYYLPPEFHEMGDKLGDSLALSAFARDSHATRVDFQAVAFMGQTAKIITRDNTRVFIGDTPQVLGCSLVSGTNHAWIENWKHENPGGVLVTYINSDPYLKSLSEYISTSRNTDRIIAHAWVNNPHKKILVLPDKFLGYVMKSRAIAMLRANGATVDPNLIEIYDQPFGGYHASCYVHEKLGNDAVDVSLLENPDAELMIHPECGCASYCLLRMEEDIEIRKRAYFLSTEQMIVHARSSQATKFIVATEMGLIYQLRKQMPEKTFMPVGANPTDATCGFMKSNTFDKLLRSLHDDRLEIVICDDCKICPDNPRHPYQNNMVIHIPREIANLAQKGIDRMLAIQ